MSSGIVPIHPQLKQWAFLARFRKMGTICEHEFEAEDPKNEGYSMVEYDLYARLGMTIRKNLRRNVYEIAGIKDKEVKYASPEIETIVRIANKLEGAKNTKVECGVGCERFRK